RKVDDPLEPGAGKGSDSVTQATRTVLNRPFVRLRKFRGSNFGRGYVLADAMICSGCGVRIQTDDPTKPGYVPERALTRETIICQRCFRIRHYNEVAEVALNPDDYRRLLSSIGEQPAVVVMVVDLFDLEGSWIAGMQRHIGGQTLHLVANKCDLFPPETNWQRMEQWLYRQAREQGL